MDKIKVAEGLVRLARELIAAPVEYNVNIEMRLSKQYQNELKKLMGEERTPTVQMMADAAKKVYDKKTFINSKHGIIYKVKINTKANQEGDIVEVEASKGSQKQKKKIHPSNIPLMLG